MRHILRIAALFIIVFVFYMAFDDYRNQNSFNPTELTTDTPFSVAQSNYKNKLDFIQNGITALENSLVNPSQNELHETQVEILSRWEIGLEVIYNAIEEELSAEEMNKLIEEQKLWMKKRDNIAKKESLEFEGGTMENLQYVSTKSRLTKERSYELMLKYIP